jgi:hypothetical protein
MVFTEEKLAKHTLAFIANEAAFVHTLNLVNVNFEFGFFATVLRISITLHCFVIPFSMFSMVSTSLIVSLKFTDASSNGISVRVNDRLLNGLFHVS